MESVPDRSPTSCYLVCTNPRSGSWLLCDGLAATGLAGGPREGVNEVEQRRRRELWGLVARPAAESRGARGRISRRALPVAAAQRQGTPGALVCPGIPDSSLVENRPT